jgi:hypothetical protein
MKTIYQSIVKNNNDVFENLVTRPNEDSVYISENIIAVSDGAGGIGLFANKWSQILVQNISNKPFNNIEAIEIWISGFWEEFYHFYLERIKDDPWKINKFESEGSAATLSVLWHIEENKFHYQSYGDTALFIFNHLTGELKIQSNLRSANSFSTNPPLINWQTEKLATEAFYTETITLNENEEIIVATDGIANYIHLAYLVYIDDIKEELTDPKNQKIVDHFRKKPIKDYKDFLTKLKISLSTDKTFKTLMNRLHKYECLPNDDYTMVFCSI